MYNFYYLKEHLSIYVTQTKKLPYKVRKGHNSTEHVQLLFFKGAKTKTVLYIKPVIWDIIALYNFYTQAG